MSQLTKQLSPFSESDRIDANEIIEKVLPYSETIACGAKEEIELQDIRSFYYVKKGVIEVSYTSEETKITVALIGKGNFFGEIGFFDGGSRVRDIRVTEDAEICQFNLSVIEQIYQNEPHLYGSLITYITQLICRKFRRVLEKNEPLTSYAASLSARRRGYTESKPLPIKLLKSSVWHTISQEIETAKAELFNISYRLQEDTTSEQPNEQISVECFQVLDTINNNLGRYKDIMESQEDQDLMWGFIFKEIFPYIMRSRFVERAYYKPKGYAGDFLMMEHIYRNKAEGDGKLGKIVDAWCLQRPGAKAIRERRKFLSSLLADLSAEFVKREPRLKIMNLACGPNRELFDFMKECDYTEAIEALCVDIDSEALQFTNQKVNIFPHKASIRLMNENLVKWALGRVSHQIGTQHIIYSSGLCDYLDRRLFRAMINRCHEHLEPGGKLILGNFAPYPDMIFMDEILHWDLIYRTQNDMQELFIDTAFEHNVEILSEPEQVNLFALATKD